MGVCWQAHTRRLRGVGASKVEALAAVTGDVRQGGRGAAHGHAVGSDGVELCMALFLAVGAGESVESQGTLWLISALLDRWVALRGYVDYPEVEGSGVWGGRLTDGREDRWVH